MQLKGCYLRHSIRIWYSSYWKSVTLLLFLI